MGDTPQQVDGIYQISNAAQLCWLSKKVDEGELTDAHIELTADISVNDNFNDPDVWVPIGQGCDAYNAKPFNGHFDGKGHTISGLFSNYLDYYNENNNRAIFSYYLGLFGVLDSSAIIENVKIDRSKFVAHDTFGFIAGINRGTIKNCSVKGDMTGLSITDSDAWEKRGKRGEIYYEVKLRKSANIGGIAGVNKGTVENCDSEVKIDGVSNVGGIVGTNDKDITNCTYKGKIFTSEKIFKFGDAESIPDTQIDWNMKNSPAAGGITGYNNGNVTGCENQGEITCHHAGGNVGKNEGKVTNCKNSGRVNGRAVVGGNVAESTNSAIVQDCENTGDVVSSNTKESSNSYCAGGNIGCIDKTSQLIHCINSGRIIGTFNLGGNCGTNVGTVKDCHNTVFSDNPDNGGCTWGGNVAYNYGVVENCQNSAEIKCQARRVGGNVGENENDVINCMNSGNISGDSEIGGNVGLNKLRVQACTNDGEVTADSIVGGNVGTSEEKGVVTRCRNNNPSITRNLDAQPNPNELPEITAMSEKSVGGNVGFNSGKVSNCTTEGTIPSVGYSTSMLSNCCLLL